MKRLLVLVSLFAALSGVSAQAQIITNYGQGTYGPSVDFPNGAGPWDGAWDGGSGQAVTASYAYLAQTFVSPVGTPNLYAYNVQLRTANATSNLTFSSAIYEWSGSTRGAIVAGTENNFTVNQADFGPYGYNFAISSGITLNPNSTYAIVINRLGAISGSVHPNVGIDYEDAVNSYQLGRAFRSIDGTSWNTSGGLATADLAFWVSFASNSLSPVPEPAVGGAVIGAGLVGMLAMSRRRRSSNGVAGAQATS